MLLYLLDNSNILLYSCADYEGEIEKMEIHSIIKSKYRAKSHNYPRIQLNDDVIMDFSVDSSNMYDYILEGDSLAKTKGSLLFMVYRKKENG